MPKPLRILLPVLFTIFLISGALIIWIAVTKPAPVTGGGTPAEANLNRFAGLSVPEFALVDHEGQPFTRDDLKGRVSIVSAVFTNCPLACPVMTDRMNGLTRRLSGTPGVQYVSISVDAKRDTPERLREFRTLHDVTAANWRFLTDPNGDDTASRLIFESGLKSALNEDRSMPLKASDGSDMFNILHPSWFFLIDGRGDELIVRDIYPSEAEGEMDRLVEDVRALTNTPGAARGGR